MAGKATSRLCRLFCTTPIGCSCGCGFVPVPAFCAPRLRAAGCCWHPPTPDLLALIPYTLYLRSVFSGFNFVPLALLNVGKISPVNYGAIPTLLHCSCSSLHLLSATCGATDCCSTTCSVWLFLAGPSTTTYLPRFVVPFHLLSLLQTLNLPCCCHCRGTLLLPSGCGRFMMPPLCFRCLPCQRSLVPCLGSAFRDSAASPRATLPICSFMLFPITPNCCSDCVLHF